MSRITLLLLTLGMFSVSCADNENGGDTFTEDMLYGRWNLNSATRNGQPTETLNTTFFEFYEDGKMVSNLSGSRENINYELKTDEMVIHQVDGRMPTDFNISEVTDSTLHLEMSLRNIPFVLHLVRGGEESNIEQ